MQVNIKNQIQLTVGCTCSQNPVERSLEVGYTVTGPWSCLRNLLTATIAVLKTLTMKLNRSATCNTVFSFVSFDIYTHLSSSSYWNFQVLRNTFGITPLYHIHQYYSPVTLPSLAWQCFATLSPCPCILSTMLQLSSSCAIITFIVHLLHECFHCILCSVCST